MQRVIIVGGGITGLSAAFYLERLAPAAGVALEVLLLEAGPRFGGKVLTKRQDGFVLEAGPDGFVPYKPAALTLIRELGIEDRLLASNDASRGLAFVRAGRLLSWPQGMGFLVPRRWRSLLASPLLSWRGKARLGLERFVPPRREDSDESVGDFVRRRCGREVLERIAEPLLSSLHVGNVDRMSLEASCPQLRALEQRFGSLTRASRSTPENQGPVFMSLRGGMAELTDSLASKLAPRIRHGACVDTVATIDDGFRVELADGEALRADAVVLAIPAAAAAAAVRQEVPDLATALGRFETASIAVISLAYRVSDLPHLAGFGFFVPRCEGRSILGGTWMSTKFANRAPEDHLLVRLFLGGAHGEAVFAREDGSLIDFATRDLAAITGIRAEPTRMRVDRWPAGYPQYAVGHRRAVDAAAASCPPGLHLAGSAYYGVGLPDCIASAKTVAERIVAGLAGRPKVSPRALKVALLERHSG